MFEKKFGKKNFKSKMLTAKAYNSSNKCSTGAVLGVSTAENHGYLDDTRMCIFFLNLGMILFSFLALLGAILSWLTYEKAQSVHVINNQSLFFYTKANP